MKKIVYLLSILLVGLSIVFVSCNKPDPDDPDEPDIPSQTDKDAIGWFTANGKTTNYYYGYIDLEVDAVYFTNIDMFEIMSNPQEHKTITVSDFLCSADPDDNDWFEAIIDQQLIWDDDEKEYTMARSNYIYGIEGEYEFSIYKNGRTYTIKGSDIEARRIELTPDHYDHSRGYSIVSFNFNGKLDRVSQDDFNSRAGSIEQITDKKVIELLRSLRGQHHK